MQYTPTVAIIPETTDDSARPAHMRTRGILFLLLFWILVVSSDSAKAEVDPSAPSTPGHHTAMPVSFRNEIMAVLSKAGCNAGTCHGNKNGKGGFKLSLRGQDPAADYRVLTRDLFGRRANSMEPDQSLLLLKPTVQVAHEGGARFRVGSWEYDLLRRWILAGMPDDVASAPALQRLEVTPSEVVLVEPTNEIQLQVRATFSNGPVRDVTTEAVYSLSGGKAEVNADGLVRCLAAGETTVLVRFLDRQEPVRLAYVPARPGFAWKEVPSFNYIDDHLFAKMRQLRMNPSDLCSDRVYLRRVFLDLLGILPTPEEARAFLEDSAPDKRSRLVDRLFERPEYADFWAMKWADLLRVEAHSLDAKGVAGFHHWIHQSVAQNKPLDVFARELITARGSTYSHPQANYFRPNRDPVARAKAAAQIFLGTRLQCAECHDHPFDRWTQNDYYDWAGLFARINYKVLSNNRDIDSDRHEWKGEQIVFLDRHGAVPNPRTGQSARPRFLGDSEIRVSDQPLADLADWLTRSDNRWFARVQANRIWHHLMGRGLVDPPDDFRATNPPSHPALLDALAADLVEHGYDARHLMRRMIHARAYQLDSQPNDTNRDDAANYAHVWVRRLGAEQLLDCQSQATGAPLTFAGFPPGFRAAQLPGVRPESKGKRRADTTSLFLEIFGKPPRLLASDTERSCECNMPQAMQLVGGRTLDHLLVHPGNRIGQALQSQRSVREIVDACWWAALTRAPNPEELNEVLPSIDAASDRRKAFEDVLWGLLNSNEFLFRY